MPVKLVNQQLIKNSNMKRLYTSIDANPGISRSQLAKMTSLSKTTVSTLVDEMINREYIVDLGIQERDLVGRKPNSLQTRPDSHYVVVLHWLENVVSAYLIDIAGTSVYRIERRLSKGETYISGSRFCLYEDILKKYSMKKILGVCIVVSAMIDAVHNEIYSTTLSLPNFGNSYKIDTIKNAFPEFPVAILEDTACYAYAEKVYGRVSERNFAFLNFGRGIGATLFIEGQMLGKASGSFTQFGHYTVNPEGPLCTCGNRGCLERMMSEQYLKERVQSLGKFSAFDNLKEVTFSDLGKAATFRDPQALSIVRILAEELAQALGNLICVVNPALIILGGKIPDLGDYFLQQVQENLTHVGFRKMVGNVTVRYSTLQSDSFLNGAMKYFFDTHYQFTQKSPDSFYVG